MPQRNIPVKESVKTSKKGEKYLSSAHTRTVDGEAKAKKKAGSPRKAAKSVSSSTKQLAEQPAKKKTLKVSRLPVQTGQLAIFAAELIEEERIKDLVADKAAVVLEVDEPFTHIEGRFDDKYGKMELCEVTVNGNDGYEMLAGVQTDTGRVVICDPSLVFDDELYDDACSASGSKRGAASFADGKAACFTTLGESECETTVFGEKGRVVVRHEDDDEGEDGNYYDDYSGDSLDDFY